MSGTRRLSDALGETGGLPPGGRILVLRPPGDADLSAVARAHAVIVTGFWPDHALWKARGWQVSTQTEGTFDAAVVMMPRAKVLAHALIAEAALAVVPGGPIWVDGQKTDGIEPLYREVRALAVITHSHSKAHGRVFCFGADPLAFSPWLASDYQVQSGFITRPGVFSADGVDPGSALLAQSLPPDLAGTGADLGAGWGWLSAQALTVPTVTAMHLVEAECEALTCARRNIPDARAHFHWQDALLFRPDRPVDFVLMNPPFHHGRAALPDVGAGFIRAAASIMKPDGRLFLVGNRGLPYHKVLQTAFSRWQEVALGDGFRVWSASRPIKPRLAGK